MQLTSFDFGGKIVWRPATELIQQSRLKQFMDRHGLATLEELQRRSTADIAWFWQAVLEDLEIEFYEPYEQVVDLSEGLAWPRWCVGAKMNIVHNCLDKWVGTPASDRVALRTEDEAGIERQLTYGELSREVNQLANALRKLGIEKGDVVALYMPMVAEVAVALFAVVKIGAIALPLFSGYGAEAVASRLNDAGAKLLFTCDGFFRRGEFVALKQAADGAALRVPSLQNLVVLQRAGFAVPWHSGRDLWWHEFIADQSPSAIAESTDADDPLMILYTSGTTGNPKGVLHAHCGFPIKAAQDLAHGFDLRERDTIFWVTEMGWMMGPWEVFGAALIGATTVFYDGAIDYPAPNRLWQIVQRHGVTVLGVSPSLVRSLMARGEEWLQGHDFSTLRILGSTGEPWNADPWMWLFEKVGDQRLPIINYSGGTEISGGIVMGNLLTPLKPCGFSGPAPGMAADVVDESGLSVRGDVGELVIRQPWIGMARGFWKDRERYLATYWSQYPNLWRHGDWAAIDQDGLWYILGRSDDTIKVAGKRIGPAEIESVLVSHEGVIEAAAIGVPDPVRGQALVCFCVLARGVHANKALVEELREKTAQALGKPLRPSAVEFVAELPKTRNAKIMRRVIRAAYLGNDPGDLSALENPAAVDGIKERSKAKVQGPTAQAQR